MTNSTPPSTRKLGKGLSSLIGVGPVPVVPAIKATPVQPGVPAQVTATVESPRSDGAQATNTTQTLSDVRYISLAAINPNKFQPRTTFEDAAIAGLAESIKRAGVIQPIVVRPRLGVADQFELIAGERRWRAATLAGLKSIPAIVKDISDEESAEWALIENVQREDLNPIDRARAFKRLCETFGLSHGDLASKLGLDRSSVANFIRLNELEEPIIEMILRGTLSGGHGKALLMAPPGLPRLQLAKEATERSYSVRRVEFEARRLADTAKGAGAPASDGLPTARQAVLADLEKRISQSLGTKVTIRTDRSGKRGQINIEFYGLEHFEDLTRRLGARDGTS